jgi:transposase InsO family protein
MYYWYNRSEWPGSLNRLYRASGISKQGFHQYLARYKFVAEEQANLLLIILQIRIDHPTMCCRMMYFKIKPTSMGRDRFESFCRAKGFMVVRRRAGWVTTDSSGVKRFDNLLEGKELTDINQAWSSDITYYEVNGRYYYLTFILDEFSRRILGHQVSSRLLTEQTTLPALSRAIRVRKGDIPKGLIFHSDGGGQYYDEEFLKLTADYDMENSMCEYAYQNPKAERINGIIKNNYLKHWSIKSLSKLTKSVDRAVSLYNQEKPHKSLDRFTPCEFEKRLAQLRSTNLNLILSKLNKQVNKQSVEIQLAKQMVKSQPEIGYIS